MSAYICNPEHFGVLAAFAVQHNCVFHKWLVSTDPVVNAQNVARLLARENIRSVAHRYPNDKDGERPGPSLKDAEIEEAAALYATHFLANPQHLTLVQVLSLCAGYSYQACECDDWRTTEAARQIEEIQGEAHRHLPGWNEADWSFDRTIPEIEVLYEGG